MSRAKVGLSALTTHDLEKYRKIKPFKLSKSINIPLNEWLDRGVDVAKELLIRDIIDGDYEAGFYKGLVLRSSDGPRTNSSKPIAHSWIRLNCGTIIDPVRWYLENTTPYVFVGTDENYESSSEYRKNLVPIPPDNDGTYPIVSEFYDIVDEHSKSLINELLGTRPDELIDTNQLSWLLRIKPELLENSAESIYQAVIYCGYSNLLINTNYKIVFNEDMPRIIDIRKPVLNAPISPNSSRSVESIQASAVAIAS